MGGELEVVTVAETVLLFSIDGRCVPSELLSPRVVRDGGPPGLKA
jgi:hypothetical protein